MTSVVIGNSLTSIGALSFRDCSNLTNIYYKGSVEDWAEIFIDDRNVDLSNATIYYYSENEPALNSDGTAYDGYYWRYVDGAATPWVYQSSED